jgi:hypothetical protein
LDAPESDDADTDPVIEEVVEQERAELRQFVEGLSADDIKQAGGSPSCSPTP